MMTALILLLAALGGGVAGTVFVRWQKKGNHSLPGGEEQLALGDGSEQEFHERTIRELRVGDVVQHDAHDFLVEGVVEYNEAGHEWRAGRLVDGDLDLILMIGLSRTRGDSVSILKVDEECKIDSFPGEILLANNKKYAFDKRGHATATMRGDLASLNGQSSLGKAASFRCRWWLFEDGNNVAVVEQWRDDFRVLVGEYIKSTQLDLMPGS